MRHIHFLLLAAIITAGGTAARGQSPAESPRFSRHVVAVFSRLGCNSGSCHGAVQGKNGFRLSLFGARPEDDYDQIVRQASGRRVNLLDVEQSLLLLKATGRLPHGGGRRMEAGSLEYRVLRNWLAAGAVADDVGASQLVSLEVTPREQAARAVEKYELRLAAKFADGSTEDVTALASFASLDAGVATVDAVGRAQAQGVGDTALVARFRADPAVSLVVVAREGGGQLALPDPPSAIDGHILAKLRRLNLPPAELADDSTFLRRARLDVTGQLPTAEEVREFLADTSPDKRERKIDQLLAEPGHAALWTLKFCDLLKATDFGVYADGLDEQHEAPRFQAWIRARLAENTPYDEFAARILTATSREGRSLEEWSAEVVALAEGYATPRKDLDLYSRRQTLDAYWQRKEAVGVSGTLQVAHAFLGLRLECAQCHRHPHDVWQQDDLLSFANFFMGVRTIGFQGENDKRYPDESQLAKGFEQEGKKLAEEVKQLKEGRGKELAEKAKQAQPEINRLKNEIQKGGEAAALSEMQQQLDSLQTTIAENDQLQREIREKDQRSKLLTDAIPKRIVHSQIMFRPADDESRRFAKVTSPLGTQTSQTFRLPGEREPVALAAGEDPRAKVVEWLRRPDNPFFAKAIVNRVWAHYFGRGIVNPPDDLSPHNPATHPALLDDLWREFVAGGFDLRRLHRAILCSRTYQQSSLPAAASAADRANYACFYPRRLPAEVLLDVLNQATGTRENLDMRYDHWPDGMSTVEIPYKPRNGFVTFMLEQFGRPPRNSAVQCDCARQGDASLLQVLSLANHPRVRQKVADPSGRVASLIRETEDPQQRIEQLYLSVLSRLPDQLECSACCEHLATTATPEEGLQAVLWSLLNTREFILQH